MRIPFLEPSLRIRGSPCTEVAKFHTKLCLKQAKGASMESSYQVKGYLCLNGEMEEMSFYSFKFSRILMCALD